MSARPGPNPPTNSTRRWSPSWKSEDSTPPRSSPKPLTDEAAQAADVVVTMGCGDTCPFYPGKRYLDWDLPDPAGLPVEEVRPIIDDIDGRVRNLLAQLARPSGTMTFTIPPRLSSASASVGSTVCSPDTPESSNPRHRRRRRVQCSHQVSPEAASGSIGIKNTSVPTHP